MNITKISICKKCGKVLFYRNLCAICAMNFQNMKPKEMKKIVEDMNQKRAEGLDYLKMCELCGVNSEMVVEGEEQQFCADCRLEE